MAKKPASTDSNPAVELSSDPSIARLGYEDAIRELEHLVESIERGDVGLEASLAAYKKGEQLLRHCKGLLDRAELTVREMSLAEAEQSAG
jgi:exodeoxyribonuclease VII small subunit